MVNSRLLSSELKSIDEKLTKALNADDGGTWAPSTAVVLGGAGLSVTGPLASSGTLTSAGGMTVSGGLTVNSGTSAFNAVTVNLDTGSTLNVKSGTALAVKYGGTATVESGGHVTINASGVLTLNGDMVVNSTGSVFVQSGSAVTLDTTALLTVYAASTTFCGSGDPAYLTPRAFTDTVVPHALSILTQSFGTSYPLPHALVLAHYDSAFHTLQLPPGATITSLGITVTFGTFVGSWTPSSRMNVQLWATDSSGSSTEIGSVTDPSTTTAAYGAVHTVALTPGAGLPGGGLVVDPSLQYVLLVNGDGNMAASTASLYITAPRMTGTMPKLRVV